MADTDGDPGEGVMTLPEPQASRSSGPPERGGRYGGDSRFSPATVVGVILAHVAAFGLGMYLSPVFHKPERHRLRMIEVKLDPPPKAPEKQQERQAETVKLEVRPYTPPPPPIPLVSSVTVPVDPAPQPVAVAPPAPPAPPAPHLPPSPPAMVQGGDIGTAMISAKPPRYPMDSRRKREQGTVVLSVTLAPDGKVSGVTVQRSSGFASLDDAARDAVKSWRWAPTIRDGEAVMVRGVVEIPFVLQG